MQGQDLKAHLLFRSVWWLSNVLLAVALVATAWSGVWEFSVRRYLKGFSDAVVPGAANPQQKVEAILAWMSNGPPRQEAKDPSELSRRDPQNTLNYRQLLEVCGTATNAFLNLSRSAGLQTRRLLLLSPRHTAMHVVAEVYLNERWVIVDPSYRVIMKDARGNFLTRQDLRNPEVFREATSQVPNYLPEYNYQRFTHIRLCSLPLMRQLHARRYLNRFLPGWDEYFDWSLLLERRSFLYLLFSGSCMLLLVTLRGILGWLADRRFLIPRFHLRANLIRATTAFFTTPEIK